MCVVVHTSERKQFDELEEVGRASTNSCNRAASPVAQEAEGARERNAGKKERLPTYA